MDRCSSHSEHEGKKKMTIASKPSRIELMALTLCVLMVVPALAAAQHTGHQMPSTVPATQQQPQAGHPPPQPASGPPTAPLPKLGRAQQESQGPRLRLDELEKMALEHNPTLHQAAAEIRAAQGRRVQAGLLPNPVVGYTGEEIRGGSLRGGQQGFFIEQTITLGGKLRLGRRVFEQEVRLAELEAEEQRLRVTNSVRLGFYRVLTSQERLATLRDLGGVAADNAETSTRLRNIGQADDTEVLQAQIEAEQNQLAVTREEARQRRLWTALAAVVGRPDLPLARLEGRLDENLPELKEEALLEALLGQSPAAQIAQSNLDRAEAELARAGRQAVPDLQVRAGLQQNRELIEATGRPVGLQGFADVGIQLPIFNRNQGNVQAARAERDRAGQEKTRVSLVLRERSAGLVQNYRDARARVEKYRSAILPRAQQAYDLMRQRWGQMAVSYPQLLFAQRTAFQAHTDYIAALGDLWMSSIALQGFLLTDGLEAPARPGEVDLPIREINVPTPRGGLRQEE
jgi:cobalt-zinc-cadmium efflux system outer membrane protein